jgi:hypothetical protein
MALASLSVGQSHERSKVIPTIGIVEDVEKRRLKEDHEYAVVTIDGQQYEVWDREIYEQLLEGAEIEYRFRKTAADRLLITDIGTGEEPIQDAPEISAEDADVPDHLAPAYLALRLAIETVGGDTAEDYSNRMERIIAMAWRYRAYLREPEYEPAAFG